MKLDFMCEDCPLSQSQVDALLQSACAQVHDGNDTVSVRCVSSSEIQHMNNEYRKKDAPTNVLTFSYPEEHTHDVALCMEVAVSEASERNINLTDYVALLLTHAFLHVLGMDHEESSEEEEKTAMLEGRILEQCGFQPVTLFV